MIFDWKWVDIYLYTIYQCEQLKKNNPLREITVEISNIYSTYHMAPYSTKIVGESSTWNKFELVVFNKLKHCCKTIKMFNFSN